MLEEGAQNNGNGYTAYDYLQLEKAALACKISLLLD